MICLSRAEKEPCAYNALSRSHEKIFPMTTANEFASNRVIVCDDSITNAMILSKLVQEEGVTDVQTFTDPRKLIEYVTANESAIDLLLLDLEMPHMNGIDVLKKLMPDGRDSSSLNFPIVVITGLTEKELRYEALGAGASDFLNKPIDQVEVRLRVRNQLRVQNAYRLQQTLAQHFEREVEKRTVDLDDAVNALVNRLSLAGELRDNETGKHVLRVGRYSRIIAEGLGLPADISYMIEKAAPLHDVGKIGIPDSVLHKKGKLDEAERQVMNSHTEKGAALLGEHGSLLIQLASAIALGHHEKWDGSGYPNRLSGESIPVEARIVSVADVFDALTTRRPYKEPWPFEVVLDYLKSKRGIEFDPGIVDVVVANQEQFRAVMEELRD